MPLSPRVGSDVGLDGCDEPGVVDAPHPAKRPRRVRSSTNMREWRAGTLRLRVRRYLAMAETPLGIVIINGSSLSCQIVVYLITTCHITQSAHEPKLPMEILK